MATNQYIGARYVPLFADPAEWNSTRSYEPLTIVLHEGNSYTSKQFVPVGKDISDADFWALTGDYNSQVEQYRKEVATFDGRITTNANNISAETTRAKAAEKVNADAISAETTRAKAAEKVNADAISAETTRAKAAEKVNADAISAETTRAIASVQKHVAIIGDSYTAVDSYYFNYLKEMMPDNIHIDRFASFSTGFVRETKFGNGTNIPNRLNDLVNGSTVYDMIIMYACINDYNNNAQNPYSATSQWGYITITDEIAAIKKTVDILVDSNAGKHARIILLPNSMRISVLNTTSIVENDYLYWYNSVINSVNGYKGLKVIANSMTWLTFASNVFALDTGYADDGVHPNYKGGYIVATNIASIINGTFTETPWAVNKYRSNLTTTINDEEVTYSLNQTAFFDGHTLTIQSIVSTSHTFSSGFHSNIDLLPFFDLWVNANYNATLEMIPYRQGFYIDYLSFNNMEGKPLGVLVIPDSRPIGSIFAFTLVEKVKIC